MEAERTTLLLVDDQTIILDGLESILGNTEGIEVVGRATNGSEAVEKVRTLKPDIVLMDISMPEMDGIEATKAVLKVSKGTRVLVLSMYNNKEFVHELLDAGASGYVLKNTRKEELREALRDVAAGLRYLSKAVQLTLDEGDRFKDREGEQGYHALTKREKQIVRSICQERTTQEIAEMLFISPQTVETHRRNILHKLDLHNTAGLVKYAMERGWIMDTHTEDLERQATDRLRPPGH
ncbi:MAG: response regulator transcription factor [Flavobacteriales bacterium]|nr:response regulator transcription factor [Flavobacteriales bacterium]MCB9166398.1 response regulator transcription factor [Flavobacteriales bacterium]